VPSGDEQAASRDGGHWFLAITNARRRFHLDRRQHRATYIDQDVVLAYGKTYNGVDHSADERWHTLRQ